MSPLVDNHVQNTNNNQANPTFNNTVNIAALPDRWVPETYADVFWFLLCFALTVHIILMTLKGIRKAKKACGCCKRKHHHRHNKRAAAEAVDSPTSHSRRGGLDSAPSVFLGDAEVSHDSGEGVAAIAREEDAASPVTTTVPEGIPQPTIFPANLPVPVAPDLPTTTNTGFFYRIPIVIRWTAVLLALFTVYFVWTYEIPLKATVDSVFGLFTAYTLAEKTTIGGVITFFTSTVPYQWESVKWVWNNWCTLSAMASAVVLPLVAWLFNKTK